MPPRTPQAPTRRSQALRTLRMAGMPLRTALAVVVALVLGEAPRRPVRLRGVAATRAVERGDVLERDEDVAVQLDVRDVFDVAVGREHAILVLAAEEGDLDLLALVLVRVVLHAWQGEPIRWGSSAGRRGSGARSRHSWRSDGTARRPRANAAPASCRRARRPGGERRHVRARSAAPLPAPALGAAPASRRRGASRLGSAARSPPASARTRS